MDQQLRTSELETELKLSEKSKHWLKCLCYSSVYNTTLLVVLQARTSKQQQPPSFCPICPHLDTCHLQNKNIHFGQSPQKLTFSMKKHLVFLSGAVARLWSKPSCCNQPSINCVCSTVLLSDKISFWAKQGKSPGQAHVRCSPDKKTEIRDWTMSASTKHAAAGWPVKKESDPISCEAHKWHLIWKDLSTNCFNLLLHFYCTRLTPASCDIKSFWNTKSDTYHALLLFPFQKGMLRLQHIS